MNKKTGKDTGKDASGRPAHADRPVFYRPESPRKAKKRPEENSVKPERAVRKNRLAALAVLLFFAALLLLYQHFGISFCPIYRIIGLPCPSCGMSRAWMALFHGDIARAFFLHPLFLAPPLLAAAVFFYEKGNRKRKKAAQIALWILAGLFILIWLIRMFLYFPRQEPMRFNEEALLPRLFRIFKK